MSRWPIMSPIERFEDKVLRCPMSGCWLWTGAMSRGGYGSFSARGVTVRAHRWSYEHHVGPIPDGIEIDHLCRVRCCVNPAHLEAVTPLENWRRGENFSAKNARKEHCPKGHPLSGENLNIDKYGRRRCLICKRHTGNAYYWKGREYEKRELRGTANPFAKLTEADVVAIRVAVAQGKTQTALAYERGVAVTTINRVVRGKGWNHV